MTPKIFLVSAALLLAGGSANAFNIGGMFEKGSQMVGAGLKTLGDTECTAAKCGSPNVSPNTVDRCFHRGEEKIARNPNCARAFLKTSCASNSRNRAHYEDACYNVAEVLGVDIAPAAPVKRPVAPRPQVGPAAPRPQVGHAANAAATAAKRAQMDAAAQYQRGKPAAQHPQFNENHYGAEDHYDAEEQYGGEEQYGTDAYNPDDNQMMEAY